MSEEQEQSNDGTLSGLKKTIIGVVTTAVMGLGTWGVTQITDGGQQRSPLYQTVRHSNDVLDPEDDWSVCHSAF